MADAFEDLTAEQLEIVLILSNKVLVPLCQFLGIVTNLFNVAIFYRLGLRDGMNISFWALSLSDMCYVASAGVNNVLLIVALSPWQQLIPVSLLSLAGWLSNYQYIFLDTSTCVQTYMALARCCCVAVPLRFKHVFTARRTLVFLITTLIISVLFRVALVTNHGLSWQTDPLTNTTKFTIWFSKDFPFFMSLEKIAGRTVFPIIALAITFTCSVILAQSLASASRKRKTMSRSKNVVHNNRSGIKLNGNRMQLSKRWNGEPSLEDQVRKTTSLSFKNVRKTTEENELSSKDSMKILDEISSKDVEETIKHNDLSSKDTTETTDQNELSSKNVRITTAENKLSPTDSTTDQNELSSEVVKETIKQNELSSKELQLVKAVALITALKTSTLVYICVFALVEASVPEFFPGRKYNRLHATVTAVMNIILSAHKSGNILIYYGFNVRFRERVLKTMYKLFTLLTLRKSQFKKYLA